MTEHSKQFTFCSRQCVELLSVVVGFVNEIISSFLIHLFSEAWMCLPFNVHVLHPCVATWQTKAFIKRNGLSMLTDFSTLSV